ncbi:unnamed protein product [Adineta steineri]|uniref:RNA helicase n=1 Tax=Adineta steineri TaxID=433720 RepID=A0A813N968_9BILA|nr:unnamed protein product [Adineta steineri]CAF1231842.1 unnamed protein product [Adineta steineri]
MDDFSTENKPSSALENDSSENYSTSACKHESDETLDDTSINKIDTFDDLNLCESLLRGIYAYGFEQPSRVQQCAMKPCNMGRDVIVQAQSGTGKTASCVIAVLKQIDLSIEDCQALVLVPAWELAESMRRLFSSIGEYMNITCHACIGGTGSIRDDLSRLEAGVQVVIGTPGRVNDALNRSKLRSDNIKMLILDEGDELVSRGFEDQIYDVLQKLPSNIQMVIFTATIPCELEKIITKFMTNPVRILIESNNFTLDHARQFYVNIEREHDNMSQQERDTYLKKFQTRSSRLLIATDPFARTIFPYAELFINYDLPRSMEAYINRIGHGGAYGRTATAINFINDSERQQLHDIEQFYNIHIKELPTDIAELF